MKITIRFTTHWPWNPCSPIIARLSGSRDWSHCLAIIDGTAYEASMLHGCRAVPVSVAMQGVVAYQDMQVDVDSGDLAKAWGSAQIGKGYDFAGAFGIPFLMSTDWADDRKWWCSELVFMLLGAGGTWLLDKNEQTRITPDHLHLCNYPKSDVQMT